MAGSTLSKYEDAAGSGYVSAREVRDVFIT